MAKLKSSRSKLKSSRSKVKKGGTKAAKILTQAEWEADLTGSAASTKRSTWKQTFKDWVVYILIGVLVLGVMTAFLGAF